MEVILIDQMEQFERSRENWDNLYLSDQFATVFMSWAFIRGWIGTLNGRWFVLGVKKQNSRDYVAFIVLYKSPNGKNLSLSYSEFSDHTSFICNSDYKNESIRLIAKYIQEKLNWEKLLIQEVLDTRLDIFLKCFPFMTFTIKEMDSTPCPYIQLENTWDQYLKDKLSQKGRKKLRKYLRNIENNDNFSVTFNQDDNIESQIETLLTLWQMKWGEASPSKMDTLRSIFLHCHKDNHLFMPIIWSGDEPAASSAIFIDDNKKCLYDFIGGWDDKFAKLSPGNTIIAYVIRFAIEKGYKIYDFLRGSEEYKYQTFGAIDRFNRNITIEKKSLKSTIRKMKNRIRKSLLS